MAATIRTKPSYATKSKKKKERKKREGKEKGGNGMGVKHAVTKQPLVPSFSLPFLAVRNFLVARIFRIRETSSPIERKGNEFMGQSHDSTRF